MNRDSPEAIQEFEAFLERKGLQQRQRERFPQFGDELIRYDGKPLGVQILKDKGIWFVDIADLSVTPEVWYDAGVIRDLLERTPGGAMSIGEQIQMIVKYWSEVTALFSAEKRSSTHATLEFLKKERVRRMFPDWARRLYDSQGS